MKLVLILEFLKYNKNDLALFRTFLEVLAEKWGNTLVCIWEI